MYDDVRNHAFTRYGVPTGAAEIRRLREDATPDNFEACYALGLALQSASAADPSDEALHWFAAATLGDHPGGHYQMALYYRGLNDQGLASYHLEASAFQGFEPALKLAREWKIAGYLDFADDEEAIQLLEEGVSRGIHEARCQLAIRLTEGRGIQPDPHRVAALYAQGANGGHRGSMRGLAACYQSGYGVAADEDAAFHWYSEAAGAAIRKRGWRWAECTAWHSCLCWFEGGVDG